MYKISSMLETYGENTKPQPAPSRLLVLAIETARFCSAGLNHNAVSVEQAARVIEFIAAIRRTPIRDMMKLS